MKYTKLILMLIFGTLNAQVTFNAPIGIKSDLHYRNGSVLDYYRRNYLNIRSVSGNTFVAIPIFQFNKNGRIAILDNQIVQFEVKNNKVKLMDIPCDVEVFDFKNKKHQKAHYETDAAFRPKDALKRIEKMLKKNNKESIEP